MTPLFAITLVLSLLFCGLSIDIGLLELQKKQMQTAADAAVIADELQFERGDSATGGDDGLLAAAQHGFVNGANNTTVTNVTSPLNNAPASLGVPVTNTSAVQAGNYAGHYDTIQITISRQVKTIFMGMINGGNMTVTATAVSSPPPCELYLGTQAQQTPTVNMSSLYGNPAVSSICPVYIGGGLGANGFYWGAYQTYLSGSASGSTGGQIHSGETFNAPARADPLASIAQPSAGACTFTNYSKGSLSGGTTTLTLSPGTYCGSVSGSTVTPGMTLLNVNVTFTPGLYVVTGGMNWQKASATGSGLTFFATNVAGTAKYGSVVISTQSGLNLNAYYTAGSQFGVASAASNGALPGILFFLDRAWVNTSSTDFDVDSSGFNIRGVLYLPNTGMTLFNGGENCWLLCGVVANNFWVSNFDRGSGVGGWSYFSGGNPFRRGSVLVQ